MKSPEVLPFAFKMLFSFPAPGDCLLQPRSIASALPPLRHLPALTKRALQEAKPLDAVELGRRAWGRQSFGAQSGALTTPRRPARRASPRCPRWRASAQRPLCRRCCGSPQGCSHPAPLDRRPPPRDSSSRAPVWGRNGLALCSSRLRRHPPRRSLEAWRSASAPPRSSMPFNAHLCTASDNSRLLFLGPRPRCSCGRSTPPEPSP